MASQSGSIDFGIFPPDATTADRYLDLYASYFTTPDSFPFKDVSSSQNTFEPRTPSLLYPWATDKFLSGFSSEMLLGTPSVQAAEQNAFPFPSATPGTACIQAQTAVIPPDNGVRDYDPRHQGATGTGLWITGGTYPPIVVPTSVPSLALSSSFAGTFPLGWVKVPQKGYDRKQWNFKPLESICFSTNGRPGINLGNALRKNFADLDGRDDPMLQDVAGAISCRLLFPGYPNNGRSCQIHSLDWTRNRQPIPRSKLAYGVAKKLEAYLNRIASVTPDESVEDLWRVGKGFMHIENMFLVSLVSVSKGSFQPEIWVAGRSGPTCPCGPKMSEIS